MPQQLSSTIMFAVFLVAIIVAANRAEDTALRSGHPRGPASVESQIVAEAAPVSPALFRHTEKLHGPVSVGIDLIGADPVGKGDVFTLKGVIGSAERLQNVDYHWNIPASVELVSGQPKGTIDLIEADQTITFELNLRALDSTNAQIHLLATARARRARFAESAQYNTVLQHALAADRERLMKSTEASAAGPGASDLKVMH